MLIERRTDHSVRCAHAWTVVARSVAAAFMVDAVLQAHRAPLFAMVVSIGAWGGLLFVHAPARSRLARRQYLTGACWAAGTVLVAVGVGRHATTGLAVLAVLGATSPCVLRRMNR